MRAGQRLSAYALISDGAGRVLLTRPPVRHGHDQGRWLLPGGGVEYGEHPQQAVAREVGEEAGLRVRVGTLREVLSDITIVGRRRRELHNVRLIYQAEILAGEPPPEQPPPGHRDEAGWYSRGEWEALPLEPFTFTVLAQRANY